MEGIIGFTTLFAGDFAPRNWAICDGSLLPVSAYPQLFALIGTTYGGDGKRTFALPDLRGRAITGAGTGASLYKSGYIGGNEIQVLQTKHIPAHTHPVQMTITPQAAAVADATSPVDGVYAINTNQPLYNYNTDVNMGPYTQQITTSSEGNANPEPVKVLQPVLALNYIICINR